MLTDAAIKALKPKEKIYKVADRDGSVSVPFAASSVVLAASGAGNSTTTSAATSPTFRISVSRATFSTAVTMTTFVFFAVLAIVPVLSLVQCRRHVPDMPPGGA